MNNYEVVAYQHNGQMLCEVCAAEMAQPIADELFIAWLKERATEGANPHPMPPTRTYVLEDTDYFSVMFAGEASDLNEDITCDRCVDIMWQAETEEEEEAEEPEPEGEDWPEQAFDDCPMCFDDTASYGKAGGLSCYRCRQCGFSWQVY